MRLDRLIRSRPYNGQAVHSGYLCMVDLFSHFASLSLANVALRST